jgi:hypothetical protein
MISLIKYFIETENILYNIMDINLILKSEGFLQSVQINHAISNNRTLNYIHSVLNSLNFIRFKSKLEPLEP